MPLTINIQLTKTEFAVGEDPTLTLELTYHGGSTQVPEPVAGSGMPAFRVVDVATGAERVVRQEKSFPGVRARLQLDNGKTHRSFHKLGQFVRMDTPGQYAISAFYEWGDPIETAESAPLRVRVLGLGVRALHVNNPAFTYAAATFINPAREPAEVMTADIALTPDGGVRTLRPVGLSPLLSRPIVSSTPNLSPGMGRWIAWIEGDVLRFVHVGDTLGPTDVGSLKLRGAPAEIVAPLLAAAHKTNLTRGPGAAVLMSVSPASTEFVVATLEADGKRATGIQAASARVDGRVRWASTLVRSDGADRRIVYVREDGGKVVASDAPWPRQGETALQPTKIAEWEGSFVSAGANISHDDVIHEIVLAWMGPPEERSLEVLTWTSGPERRTSWEPLGALEWAHTEPIETAIVRVRAGGKPAILIRSVVGDWHIFDGLGFAGLVFEPFRRMTLLIDVAFFGPTEAVLLVAQPGGGVIVRRLDGSELPPKQK